MNDDNEGAKQTATKKCPVRFAVMPAAGKLAGQIVPGMIEGMCIQESCAWWFADRKDCAINVLAATVKPAAPREV